MSPRDDVNSSDGRRLRSVIIHEVVREFCGRAVARGPAVLLILDSGICVVSKKETSDGVCEGVVFAGVVLGEGGD